jgi:DNA-binding MarR family transcriptional regulator
LIENLQVTEKEFEVINVIAAGLSTTQRALATQTGISLGMTNLLLKRLVKKGYLRARQLDRRKVQYLLTTKGFAEKARKSYHYTLKTIHSLTGLKTRILEFAIDQYQRGGRHFVIVGDGDLGDLAELALRNGEQHQIRYTRVLSWEDAPSKDAVFLVVDGSHPPLALKLQAVDLLDVLSSRTPALASLPAPVRRPQEALHAN